MTGNYIINYTQIKRITDLKIRVKTLNQSPLLKGGGVADQCENLRYYVGCGDGGLRNLDDAWRFAKFAEFINPPSRGLGIVI